MALQPQKGGREWRTQNPVAHSYYFVGVVNYHNIFRWKINDSRGCNVSMVDTTYTTLQSVLHRKYRHNVISWPLSPKSSDI
ncbi:unnamed protein product [Enterobius vermicularis]|uniref:DDE_Tnp_1_7 domain-containing protein n=1 Tax=Enterobius vermicularis TaxID=51028 RepID=A0A0N4V0H0_ENTVE|nr:unnamed protein product [Enterobius vermicularis]